MKRPPILFLKAKIPGGARGDLFDQPVQVQGYTRGGTYVAPHTSHRKHARPVTDTDRRYALWDKARRPERELPPEVHNLFMRTDNLDGNENADIWEAASSEQRAEISRLAARPWPKGREPQRTRERALHEIIAPIRLQIANRRDDADARAIAEKQRQKMGRGNAPAALDGKKLRELYREAVHGAGAEPRRAARAQIDAMLAASGMELGDAFRAHHLDLSAYFASRPIG